ncbi:Rpa1ap [Castilleja foliolosa]|uniref:Rpa1ap n=1 Tax=Castilleja foliolosa TaxID=1961234 RepID=A0ABD3BF69_9LAMI
MAANDVFDPEFQEIFEAFSQRTAQVLSVWYLKITRMEGRFWLHGRVNAVDNDRDFWHLSCSMCARRVWRGEDGLMTCVHCGFVNHNAIYRYSLEVEFRDESGTAWLVLSHEASTRLIGQSVDDVMGVQGESVTRLPDWIVEDLEGREALFEVFKTDFALNDRAQKHIYKSRIKTILPLLGVTLKARSRAPQKTYGDRS